MDTKHFRTGFRILKVILFSIEFVKNSSIRALFSLLFMIAYVLMIQIMRWQSTYLAEKKVMSIKVDEFIEQLSQKELVFLLECVNTKEFIGMISCEIKRQTEEYWDKVEVEYQASIE